MHFPYNLLCKQIVFPPAMKHCTLWLVLRECLEPAAQQHSGCAEGSPSRFFTGLSSADSSCNKVMRGDQVFVLGMD